MNTVIDTFREQLQKQQLPIIEFQQQWFAVLELAVEAELDTVQRFWKIWFQISRVCLHGGAGSNPAKMGQDCVDLVCQLNQLLLEQAHERQRLRQDWRERINQILC